MATIIIKDKNLVPENIKDGVTILKVTGTYEGGGGTEISNQDKTVSSSTSDQTVTYDSGYTGLGTVTVNKYTLDSKTVDASTVQQVVTSSADGLSSVTVNAVTSSIDGNIQAGNIKSGVNILGVTGSYSGTNQLMMSISMNPSTNNIIKQAYELPQGYAGWNSIQFNAVTSSIDPNITADNIKAGVTILGVEGTYVGDSAEINNQKKSITPTRTLQKATPDSGYTGMDEVTVYGVTSSIDSNITAGNIKSGVNILGVTGTYGGSSGGDTTPYPLHNYDGDSQYDECVCIFDTQQFVCQSCGSLSNQYDKAAFANGGRVFYASHDPGGYSIPNMTDYEGSGIYLVSYMSGDERQFFITAHTGYEQNSQFTLTSSGVEMSVDNGTTWASSITLSGHGDDYLHATYTVKIRGGGDVYLNMVGYGQQRVIHLITVDEMPPMPDFPEEPEDNLCPDCGGSGETIFGTCQTCGGTGYAY